MKPPNHRKRFSILLLLCHVSLLSDVSLAAGEEHFVRNQALQGSREVVDASQSWHVTDDGLKRLRSYVLRGEIDIYMQNKVQTLILDGTRITNAGLVHLEGRDGLTNLRMLSLADTQITDVGLLSLSGLKQLRRLNLGRTLTFTGGFSGVRVTEAGLARLRKELPNCQIEHTRIPLELSEKQREQFTLWSPVAESVLNEQGDLVSLRVRPGAKLTEFHLQSLAQLKHLTELHTLGVFQTKDVSRLVPSKSLQRLCLQGCPIDDAAMESLGKLTSLQVLDLADTKLTDQGLNHLRTLTQLTALDLRSTEAHTPGLQRLRKSLADTRFLFDPWRVVQLPYQNLTLNDRFELADVGSIGYRDSHDQLEARLKQLLAHPSLEKMDLRHSSLTDDDLKIIARMPNLKELDLGNTQITSVGVAHLAKLTRLEKLNLWHTKITDDGGLPSLEKLPQLWSLELDETRIDDAALPSLSRMPKLRYTELWHTDVTRAGVEKLQTDRPQLEIRSNPRR